MSGLTCTCHSDELEPYCPRHTQLPGESSKPSPLPYPIRLGDRRREEYQAAADASGRTLAGWIKWTCDNEVKRLASYGPAEERE